MAQLFELDGKTHINPAQILKKLNLQDVGKVQQIIDSEILRLCDPYVPKDTSQLIRSGLQNTVIGSGLVVYKTPYARKQYYFPMNHSEGRMHMWFEVMKRSGGREKILNAARKAVNS